MAGRPPPLFAFGQGPYQGAAANTNNENDYGEVYSVNLSKFGPLTPGNEENTNKNKSNAALRLFNKPGNTTLTTPKAQIRVTANWQVPPVEGKPLTVNPNVYSTPKQPISTREPRTPIKNNGVRRRNRKTRKQRKSRRNTRRLRK